jgi:galactose oxidase-like protein
MRRLKRSTARGENRARCAHFALGLFITAAVGSCRLDQRSVTDVSPAPPSAATVTQAAAGSAVVGPSGDTFLNVDAVNYAVATTLSLYTWPDDTIANAIVMKFDLASIPAGSTISRATLNLYLAESDATADATYTATVHQIVHHNPDLTRATGSTYDGINAWTPSACCRNGIPLAQSDIGPAVDTRSVDKVLGFKPWDVTSIVQGWFTNPATNFGLLVNADASKLRDRYRSFKSSEDPVTANRPYLTVEYTAAPPPPPPPPPDEQTSVLPPSGDTFLNIDAVNYATAGTLGLYTWPDDTVANAIVMKFDLASVPAGSTVSSATLSLNLTGNDATADATYTVTVHTIVNRNPDVTRATGSTYDGVNGWSPNGCCRGNVPLAQADISAPVDTRNVDKTPGFKSWDVTSIVRGWLGDRSTNFGLLLNSDASKLRDRYRSFSSAEDPVVANRPYLTVRYTPPATPPPPPPTPEASVGQWSSSVFPAPIVQLHVHLLPDGTVLSWGRVGDPQVWNPATGVFTPVPSPAWLFCAGHNFLPDGRLLVAGGHISDDHGLPATTLFDATTRSWQVGPPMARGRWYPTNTTLPDGQVLTLAGTDESGAVVPIPEVWNGSSWRQLTTASMDLPYYPRTFVAPDGRVFYAGELRLSMYLDVTGTGRWTNGPVRVFPNRDYGSAVMYEPGKILYAGGADPPTNTAEIIDLNQPNPTWRFTGSMAYARRQMNATLLPTGEVLVTGGTSAPGFNNAAGAVHVAELWSPTTGTWTTVRSNAVNRMYHSTSLLLPDGRVLHTGSGDGASAPRELNYELYSPPYLFRGARPSLTGFTPTVVAYGQTLNVETPDGAGITKVTFIRTGSVTHAFDQAARLVPLSFSQVSGGLAVTLPASRTTAPPGPYLLFLVNTAGVPSIGRIMRLE